MNWKINYSAQALEDLKAVYEYIAFELLVPETARGQVKRIMDSINKLDEMPMMYKSYDEEPWKSRGLRVFPIDNYIVFYLPAKDSRTVNIVRIIYGGMDISKQLEKNTTLPKQI